MSRISSTSCDGSVRSVSSRSHRNPRITHTHASDATNATRPPRESGAAAHPDSLGPCGDRSTTDRSAHESIQLLRMADRISADASRLTLLAEDLRRRDAGGPVVCPPGKRRDRQRDEGAKAAQA